MISRDKDGLKTSHGFSKSSEVILQPLNLSRRRSEK
jgi:hypothetical protein